MKAFLPALWVLFTMSLRDESPQSQVASAAAPVAKVEATLPSPAAKQPPLPQVLPGFEIQLIAAPPLVEYPTLACFDDLGHLYVSEGANVNDEHPITSKTLPRSIRRLEDTDGDGIFDRSIVFADKMVFPYGGVWHNGALYVASDPAIWRLEDTNGDGVADQREVVITGFGAVGHASCVKGGYLGLDGWMYFCGGNDAGYDLTDRDGKHLKDPRPAPCVFRMRFDGTGLEYFANGAAGVYDLSFDPSGDLFGVVTILKYPRGDGLMHWVYGGAYESSRPTSRYANVTGEKLPPLHEWPQTSPSGLVQLQSDAFGNDYRGNLFAAHFNTHVVTRNVVERDGASWKMSHEENFVKSDNLNCRFTDVLEDADGSLVVVNTGGWFRIGCPTSEVGEGDLRGSIFRVRKIGQKSPADPRGLKIDWQHISNAELAKQLDDPRLVVRERTLAEFARRGAAAIPALQLSLKSSSPDARRNAVWALTRIDHADARAAVRQSLADTDSTNLMAALHSVGLWRDPQAFDRLVELVKSDHAAVRREAASALGRLGNAAGVPPLLDQLAETSDRFFDQAVIFALIEIDARDSVVAGLANSNPNIQRGALLALDQMRHGQLTQAEVTPLLQSTNFALQKAALEVIDRHDGWSDGVVDFAQRWLAKKSLTKEESNLLISVLQKARANLAMQQLIGETLDAAKTPDEAKQLLLEAMAQSRPKSLPPSWQKPLEACLQASDDPLARQAIATIVAIGKGNFQSQLASAALNAKAPLPVRIDAAIAAVVTNRQPPSDDLFTFLAKQCTAEETEVVGRLSISQTLGNAKLTAAQLERLVKTIAVAGPLELPSLLKAYEECQPPTAGEQLSMALLNSPGLVSLSAVRLQRLIERYPHPIQAAAAPLLKKISTDTESIGARMKELEFALEGGDATRGQGLFAGKAACSQCHRIDNKGANVGPDLSQIGDIRTRRDLLEAIAFPSATFARGYEPVTVIASGRPLSGILRKETTEEIYLLTADRSEKAVPRDEIDEIVPSRVSIMPQGLDRNLTGDELRDLVAFLSSRKSKSSK